MLSRIHKSSSLSSIQTTDTIDVVFKLMGETDIEINKLLDKREVRNKSSFVGINDCLQFGEIYDYKSIYNSPKRVNVINLRSLNDDNDDSEGNNIFIPFAASKENKDRKTENKNFLIRLINRLLEMVMIGGYYESNYPGDEYDDSSTIDNSKSLSLLFKETSFDSDNVLF